jgi:hypothetical protein
MNGMILSHIPLHEASMGRFGVNIHGHLHSARVKKARGIDAKTGATLYSDKIDTRYHCVCVEQTDYTPILFEDVIKERRKELAFEGDRFHDYQRLKRDITRSTNYPASSRSIPYSTFRRLLPIPQTEVDANPTIKAQQNPGY